MKFQVVIEVGPRVLKVVREWDSMIQALTMERLAIMIANGNLEPGSEEGRLISVVEVPEDTPLTPEDGYVYETEPKEPVDEWPEIIE